MWILLSGDTKVQASATLTVGVIFLISLRKALGLRVTPNYVSIICTPIYFWALSTAMVIWGDMVERAAGGLTVVSFTLPGFGSFTLPEWYKMSDFFFIFGLAALVVVVF